MLAVCSAAADTLLSHHVLFGHCRSFRLPLLHSSSCSTFTVRPAGHSTAKISQIHLFLPEETTFAYTAHLSKDCLLFLPPASCPSLPLCPLIVTLKTPRPSGNSKKLFSIAAAYTLCHRVPKAVGISLSSDLSTALAIQASPLVSTPNLPLDSSFHQVLLICLLPNPVTTRPILLNDTSEQVEDPSTVKTSLPAIICFHPCFYPIILITSKSNKLWCEQTSRVPLAINSFWQQPFIPLIIDLLSIFIFHCFQSIFNLSLSFFQCIQHITYLFKFLKPHFKAVLTTYVVSSILTHYFLFNQFIHHTLRATWAPCLNHNY